MDRYREDVWRFLVVSVGADEADDCFQETFISALRAYPRLRRDSNLKAWVLTIAHRKAIDCHRRHARKPLPVGELETLDDPATAGPQARDDELWEAVHELPPRQRSAVVLRFVADLTHREIATAMDCSEQAARRSLHEGLTTLRRVLQCEPLTIGCGEGADEPAKRPDTHVEQSTEMEVRA